MTPHRKLCVLVVLLAVGGGLIACNCGGAGQQFLPGLQKQDDAKEVKPRFTLDAGILDTWGKGKNGPGHLRVTPDGKYLLTMASSNTENVQVWDLTTLKKLHGFRAEHGTMHVHIAVAADSRTGAYVHQWPKASLVIFDLVTGEKRLTIHDENHFTSSTPHRALQFSPDGSRIVMACKGAIVTWDTATGKIVSTWPGGAMSLAPFFENGTRIASSSGNSVSIWDVEKGKVIKNIIGGTSAFAITPDEKTLFSQDGFVRIWDLPGGNQRKEVREYSGTYQSVVTPNNRTAIWPTNVGVVVFDLETGTKIQDHTFNRPYLMGLTCTSDGRTLITSDSDGLIKGWNLNAQGMVE